MSQAVLTDVVYLLFDWESDVLGRAGSEVRHSIDGGIRLVFSDGATRYVSWGNEPVQYCVEVQDKQFFFPSDEVVVDASTHPLWRQLIQRPVALVWVDSERQTLELRGPEVSLYVMSSEGGEWDSDTLTIAGAMPT